MKRLALLICAALFMLLPSSALAARKPLHVLIVQSEDALSQAQALTRALKRAVAASDEYRLADGEFSLEVMTLALGCSDPPDRTCLGKIAAKIKTNQFVWGIMERDGRKLVVRMRLWQRGKNGAEVSARYAARQDEDGLNEVARDLLGRLGGDPAPSSPVDDLDESEADEPDPADDPPGDLVIRAGGVDGQVVIDGRAYGKIRSGYARVQVPAGDHEVLIRAAGHYEAIGDVVVEAKRRSEITLYPEPRHRSKQDDGSNAGAGWAAIGAGGLLVAGGVYSSVKVKEIEEDPAMASYRAQFTKGQNACTEAERGTERPGAPAPGVVADLCSEGRTYQALQYLFFGLGSVAVGTGALILLTDSPSQPPQKDEAARRSVRAEPRFAVGRTSAEVGMRLKF